MTTEITRALFASKTPIYERAAWVLWIVLLMTIPITSFPLVSQYFGYSTVSPLPAVPLILLLIVWLLPYFLRGGRFPTVAVPLIVFVLIAILSSLRAPFLEIYPFKGFSVLGREVRALLTLAVGISFYLVAITLPNSDERLRKSLRWLYIGAIIMLLWSSVQVYRLPYSYNPPPVTLNNFHRLFSITNLFRDRVTGFAYEPSWLADQLTVLYLPLWLASVINGYTVFGSKSRRISVELLLFLWGCVVLFFTYSRIGLLAFTAAIAILLLFGSWRWIDDQAERRSSGGRWSKGQWKIILWFCLILIIVIFTVGVVSLAALTNERIRGIMSVDLQSILNSERLPVIYNLANHLEYAERLLYWISAFLIFSRYPLIGIGLGNMGFLFRDVVPAFGYYLPEILMILRPGRVAIANTKSLWMRLLSETGLLGILSFMSWNVVMAISSLTLVREWKGIFAVIGLAGALAITAFLFEGFSLDTFALPQLWIIMGFLSAAVTLRQSRKEQMEPIQ
ncbi:MAG: hypothetical protein GTO18_17275 [Anaerolineales bacterium]|nr:hypothetical protein [Anaerolineales bacterium]